MSVKLYHKSMSDNFPLGHVSVFETVEEAQAQAASDVETGRDPQPDRIVDEDGTTLSIEA